MTFDEYQIAAHSTAIYPRAKAIVYPALGLGGEAGEVLNKVKKIYRDFDGKVTAEHKESIRKELGDVLWYLAMLASDLGLDMSAVARANINELKSRHERGTLKGEGDDR